MKMGGLTIHMSTGEYNDGTLGEIFVDLSKEGSMIRTAINMWCRNFSLALQYGAPVEVMIEKNMGVKQDPSGPVQGHESIKMASSIWDLIMKELAIHYLGRDDLKNVKDAE
jgi:ribonucleoside-diphosphate reductase alpha chain